jgi:transposase-like protein
MDAPRVMAGNKGLQALIKRSAPESTWTHCMIHLEPLATKELCPKLSEVMDTVIKTVKYIQTRPLKSRVFAELCEEMGAQYLSLLFYCNSR